MKINITRDKGLFITFSILLLFAILFQFVSFEWLVSILRDKVSEDGIISEYTLNHYKNTFIFFKYFILIFPLAAIVFLSFTDFIGVGIQKMINVIVNSSVLLYNKISLTHLFWFSTLVFISLGLLGVYGFDIGQDEAFFLHDIKNINSIGAISRDDGKVMFSYDIPSLPLNVIVNQTVPIWGFSVAHVRLIILGYSTFLIIAFLLLFGKKLSKILIPVVFLFPGMVYLSSGVYLETTALFFIIIGLFYLKKFEEDKNNKYFVLSSLFMAIAITAKLQLILWIGLILVILLIVDYNRNARLLFKYAMLIYLLFGAILALSFFHYGYVNGILQLKFNFLGGNTDGAFSINFTRILNKSMMLNELVFLPLMFFIWVKSWIIIQAKYNNLYMKVIYIGAIAIVLHWLFFFSVMTWRNVFIGIAFNAVLFTIYLQENIKQLKLILIPYILIGSISNYAFVKNGVLDDVQYYKSHVLKEVLNSEISNPNNQDDFFEEANRVIHKNDRVYTIGQIFIPDLLIEKNKVKLLKEYRKTEGNDYLVIYPGLLRENYIKKYKYEHIILESELLFSYGDYYLYLLP